MSIRCRCASALAGRRVHRAAHTQSRVSSAQPTPHPRLHAASRNLYPCRPTLLEGWLLLLAHATLPDTAEIARESLFASSRRQMRLSRHETRTQSSKRLRLARCCGLVRVCFRVVTTLSPPQPEAEPHTRRRDTRDSRHSLRCTVYARWRCGRSLHVERTTTSLSQESRSEICSHLREILRCACRCRGCHTCVAREP